MKKLLGKTFSSLKVRNYRLYYFGQAISVSGTFLQALAQDWLVLKLTNSGTMLGITLAFQFFPMLILGSYGGVIADRFSKLKLLYITQSVAGVLALSLGILVLTDKVELWMVFVFALCLGIINSVDNPVRQSFVIEMVGKDQVKNAISIWVILLGICRVIGPGIAGILIATVGLGMCFIINAVSYIAVLVGLSLIRKEELHHLPPVQITKGQIREGLRYVWNTPVIFITLMMMAIIGTITFEWQASLPLFAKFILKGDAATYSALSVSMGVGMIFGGLFNASFGKSTLRPIIYSAFLFGIFLLIVSQINNLISATVIFVFIGVFSIMFANLSNSTLQINSDPKMRGRVMSLWSMAFMGSTAIGGPFIGWVGEYFGARSTLMVGGFAAIIAATYGIVALRKIEKENMQLNLSK